ncbi:putative RmlC-like cupins superfamily protein [Hibiscus syriacus]|uniref:RmlC-like cupins superfamily protein n=1 Tax=Hibiscus syriacus TaxID=106335 RepID=A0A6A3BVY4_HIBSY|nr:putative RmlC-like cupins superfamily protein [Hibiscus syriacus]
MFTARNMMPISPTNGAANIIGPTSVISLVFRFTKLVASAFIDGQGQVVGHLVVNYRFVDCDATPVGSGEFNVRADCSLDYKPIENNWVYPSHAECAAKDGGKPLEWRKRYGWTGYRGKFNTSNPVDNCGKCLKVLNRYTKDSITVRIIDTCGGEVEAMVLDYETAFKPIDTDGKGYEAGHLNVVYLFVECDDDVLVYSQ